MHLRRFLPDQVITEISVAATAVLATPDTSLRSCWSRGWRLAGSRWSARPARIRPPYGNAIVAETDDPAEMASALHILSSSPRSANVFVWRPDAMPPTSPGRS